MHCGNQRDVPPIDVLCGSSESTNAKTVRIGLENAVPLYCAPAVTGEPHVQVATGRTLRLRESDSESAPPVSGRNARLSGSHGNAGRSAHTHAGDVRGKTRDRREGEQRYDAERETRGRENSERERRRSKTLRVRLFVLDAFRPRERRFTNSLTKHATDMPPESANPEIAARTTIRSHGSPAPRPPINARKESHSETNPLKGGSPAIEAQTRFSTSGAVFGSDAKRRRACRDRRSTSLDATAPRAEKQQTFEQPVIHGARETRPPRVPMRQAIQGPYLSRRVRSRFRRTRARRSRPTNRRASVSYRGRQRRREFRRRR